MRSEKVWMLAKAKFRYYDFYLLGDEWIADLSTRLGRIVS